MTELGLVALLLFSLVALPAFVSLVPWTSTLLVGSALVILGLVVGLPASLFYHVAIWRAAQPVPPPRWWLNPTSLHGRLSARDRQRVLGWFRVGAVGFVMALVGCALVAMGAWRS